MLDELEALKAPLAENSETMRLLEKSRTAKLIGTALIVSKDTVATRQLAEAMQELALSVEVCIKVSDVLWFRPRTRRSA